MHSRALSIFLALSSLVFLSACSSSNSGRALAPAPVDTTPPVVDESFPESDTENFSPNGTVRFEFSEEVDPESVVDAGSATNEDGGIRLYSGEDNDEQDERKQIRRSDITLSLFPTIGSDPVTGEEIDINATAVTLTHASGRFALNTLYTVEVNDSIRDLADDPETDKVDEANYLTGSFSIEFTVRDGQWRSPSHVNDSGIGDAYDPDIAGNADGLLLGVWRQFVGGSSQIWVSQYDIAQRSWGAPMRLDSVDAESAFSPKISMNDSGDAAVVWYQPAAPGEAPSIWTSRLENGVWSAARNISEQDSSYTADSPELGMDSSGNIHVIWRQETDRIINNVVSGRFAQLVTRRYDSVQQDWMSVEALSGVEQEDANMARLFVNKEGASVTVWVQEGSGNDQIHARRYRSVSGWEPAQRVDTSNLGNASSPELSLDPNNDGILVWEQSNGFQTDIWTARYSGATWGQVQKLELDDRGPAVKPNVVMTRDGNGFVIWLQDTGSNELVRVREFDPREGWMSAETLTTQSNGVRRELQVFVDREGHAIAMWINDAANGSTDIWYSRYTRYMDWSLAASLGNVGSLAASLGVAPVKEDGRAVALWYGFDGSQFRPLSALFRD